MKLGGLFTNGGKKISFGRVSAFIVIILGLGIAASYVGLEYKYPSGTVTLEEKHIIELPIDGNLYGDLETAATFTGRRTERVPEHNWSGLAAFLAAGIAPLATLLYTGSKATTALQTLADNKK